MVAPRGGEQQDLGLGRPAPRRALDQQAPDLLGAGRAAGLARQPPRAQRLGQAPRLGGLARPVDPLEGDEDAGAALRSRPRAHMVAQHRRRAAHPRAEPAARHIGAGDQRQGQRRRARHLDDQPRHLVALRDGRGQRAVVFDPRLQVGLPIAGTSTEWSAATSGTAARSPIQTSASASTCPSRAGPLGELAEGPVDDPLGLLARSRSLSRPEKTKTIRRVALHRRPGQRISRLLVCPVFSPSSPSPAPISGSRLGWVMLFQVNSRSAR
jgi:hypothetical protein